MASRQYTKYCFLLDLIGMVLFTAGFFSNTWFSKEKRDGTIEQRGIIFCEENCPESNENAKGLLIGAFVLMTITNASIMCFLICECVGWIIYIIGSFITIAGVVLSIGIAYIAANKDDAEMFEWGLILAGVAGIIYMLTGTFVLANGWKVGPRIITQY